MLARSRLILGLCGLALAAPALPVFAAPDDPQSAPAGAQPPIAIESEAAAQPWSTYQPAPGAQPSPAGRPSSGIYPHAAPAPGAPRTANSPHQHKGLFGWRHCVECQRARVKRHDGVDIPPPPSQPGMVSMTVPGETIVTGPGVIVEPHGGVINESQEAGYAVVGPGGDPSAPGVAVAGGDAPSGEPTPVGVARGAQNPWADPRMAAMTSRPGPGAYDASVVPTRIPDAPQAMSGPGHDRPHVIGHVLGLPQIGRHWRERQEKDRQQHAAIAYGDSAKKVSDLPASMVYPNGGH